VAAPGGLVLYAGTRGGQLLKVHLTEPGKGRACDASGGGALTAVAVSPGGESVFTAAADGLVCRWSADLAPARPEWRAPGRVTALAALDATRAAAGCAGGQTLVFAATGAGESFDPGARAYWLAAGPRGTLAQNGPAGRVVVNRRRELATGDTGVVRAGAFSPDGGTLFTAGQDGVVRSWVLPRDLRARAALDAGRVAAVGVSSDGASFAVAANRRVTLFAEVTDERPAWGAGRSFAALRVLDGGAARAVTLEGPAAVVRDLRGASGAEVARLRTSRGQAATAAALAPDGTRAAVGDGGGRVRAYVVSQSRLTPAIDTGRPVRRLAFSPDGRYVAAPTPDGVGVWLVETGEQVAKLEADDQAAFAFLPQERLATAGRDGVVRVRTFTGREELALLGHVGRVTGLGASPDGRTLVSGGATGEVKFWDLRTGTELLGLRRHSTPITVVEFAASGKLLVTAGDGQVAVWDARE
jgi:WD40 repeat protein